jgi:phosphoglycolate phosphatase
MKTVIFDLDGTLADTSADLLNAANKCFSALGHKTFLNLIDHAHIALRGGRALLKAGFDLEEIPYTEEDISKEYPLFLNIYEENLSVNTSFYPGVRRSLKKLKGAGFNLGICTNKPAYLAEKLMCDMNFRTEFCSLVGSDSIPFKKPHPEHYFESVRRCEGVIEKSLLVGDTITDYDTARAAGVPIVLVDFGPGRHTIEDLNPDAFLSDYNDLFDICNKLIS